ncbi:hypothetical protein PR048_024646 [Dryococelus australis]|uniref:Uncharacterized protein n=1 Tax=Dryococelus australis TaxID=614101 RepID=A0ABQ9GP58_9NEOP|nr:hypothetical protein PR048_024646 [Dryococelus australis]
MLRLQEHSCTAPTRAAGHERDVHHIVMVCYVELQTNRQPVLATLGEHHEWPILQFGMFTRAVFAPLPSTGCSSVRSSNMMVPFHRRGVRQLLDHVYPDRWIGRAGPVARSPRSPDLNLIGFFLLVHVKVQVYQTPVASAEDLIGKDVCASRNVADIHYICYSVCVSS